MTYAQEATTSTLQEVVITAQRREESLQRATVAVQEITGDQILRDNVLSLTDLGRIAPAVQIEQNAGAYLAVTMRGVSSSDTNELGSPAISISQDGVYMPRGTSPIGIFYDIARVKVLKGPQRTLYGGAPTSLALGGYRPDCDPTIGQFWGKPYTSINQQASEMMTNAAQNFPLGAPVSSGMIRNPPERLFTTSITGFTAWV